MAEIVTFRVPPKLKARMERLRHVNWSELLRSFVERSVTVEEEHLRRKRDDARVRRALREMDRLARIGQASPWVGSEEVIRWRRSRRSSSTQASR